MPKYQRVADGLVSRPHIFQSLGNNTYQLLFCNFSRIYDKLWDFDTLQDNWFQYLNGYAVFDLDLRISKLSCEIVQQRGRNVSLLLVILLVAW